MEYKKLGDFKTQEVSPNEMVNRFRNLTGPQREKMLEDWNKNPQVQDNDIKAIDERKEASISRKKLSLLEKLSVVGIVFLIISSIVLAVVGYIIWNDGSLKPITMLACGNVSLTCEKQECIIPQIPDCNCGNVICGNFTCPTINIEVKNVTS